MTMHLHAVQGLGLIPVNFGTHRENPSYNLVVSYTDLNPG